MTGYCLPRTEVFGVHGDDPRGGRRIMVAWPEEPPPPAGYPVIYLLDANATFGTLVEAIRMRAHRPAATGVVPAVVVGVGSERDGPYDRVRRTYDYTPPNAAGAATGLETGGRDRFEAFLLGELAEQIEERYPIDRSRRILLGHSLGGFFVLDLLLRRPDAYAAYIAISPSIWWDRDRLLQAADALGATLGGEARPPRVMIAVGEYEQVLAPWQAATDEAASMTARRDARGMVDQARELARRLSQWEARGLTVRYDEVAGEDHASVVLSSISRGLRFVLAPQGGR